MTSRKLVGTVLAVLATFAVLAGCSGSGGQVDHNQADITFAQGMIPHHEQALAMAKLVNGRTGNAKVVDLAGRIQRAQDPEIRQLNGLLKAWGAIPSGDHSAHGSMTGMMTNGDMATLGQVKDAVFDRKWLEMMVEHHEGAVAVARTEVEQGLNAEVKALAQKVIDGQQAEIAEMRALLG